MPGHALRLRDRHHRRYLRRLLGSGGAAAPERESLALLPSGPDAVRTLPVRGTRSSTPRAQTLSRRTVPRTAFGPAWSGFRVQGTADSPPSATGQAEGTTSARDYHRAGTSDRGHPLHRRRLPVGVLGEPGAARARVALSRPALLAARDDRAARGGERGGGAHVRPRARARALARLRGALRNAVRDRGRRRARAEPVEDAARSLRPVCSSPGASGRCSARSRSPTSRARLYLDDAESIREALRAVPNADADRIAAMLDDDDGRRRVRAAARRDALGCGHACACSGQDGRPLTGRCGSPRRRSCSVAGSRAAVAGGWQPLLSYDTVLANFAPELERVPPPDSPGAAPRVLPGRAHDGRGRAPPRRGLRSRSRSGSRGGFAVRARLRWEGGSSRVGQRCPLESSLVKPTSRRGDGAQAEDAPCGRRPSPMRGRRSRTPV